jgi:hypothetical protein
MSDYWKEPFRGKIKLKFSPMPWAEITLNDGRKFKTGDEVLIECQEIKLFKPFKQYISIDSMKEDIPDSDSIAPKKVVKKPEPVKIDEDKKDLAE